ncbi:VanZ family protein [Desulfococcus sp.]|uniref:VanZ family protein n=1 Tax=Desulfococcus sp. TaxID=2025834 RepID=UPI0035946A2D
MDCGRIPLKILICLGAAVLAGIIIMGLNPRHSLFTNKVGRPADGAGIRFRKYGIAFTKPFDPVVPARPAERPSFSVEIAFTSEHRRKNGFGLLFMFHDGDDASQFLMGQWHSRIVFMNGDDYDHSRKAPRIMADIAAAASKAIVVTLVSGPGGTRLYMDGGLVLEKKGLKLTLPGGDRRPRLVLGNSVYGDNPWEGAVYGFAAYPHALTPADVANHHGRWLKSRDFSFAMGEGTSLLYLFDETSGGESIDRSGLGRHLETPAAVTVLKPRILAFPPDKFRFSSNFIQDIIINFIGFVPFGLVFTAILLRVRGLRVGYAMAASVLLGFAVSLAIEIGQAWIPSRSSSLLDLLLNTGGAGSGAAVWGILCRK